MKIFKIDDYVMYMSKKIYRITNIEKKNFSGEEKDYFLLKDNLKNETVYLPLDNELALKNIRHLLTKNEIEEVLNNVSKYSYRWNNAYKERAQLYNDLIKENNLSKLIAMCKEIKSKHQEFKASKKNLPNLDMSFYKGIAQTIQDEFSFVLGIPHDEIEAYIASKIY